MKENNANKKLDAILEKTEQEIQNLAFIINNIISELALDPENDLLIRIGQKIMETRTTLASINSQLVDALAPNNKEYLKRVKEAIHCIKEENKQKRAEIENAGRNTYSYR